MSWGIKDDAGILLADVIYFLHSVSTCALGSKGNFVEYHNDSLHS